LLATTKNLHGAARKERRVLHMVISTVFAISAVDIHTRVLFNLNKKIFVGTHAEI
jgi:hypothetical protein